MKRRIVIIVSTVIIILLSLIIVNHSQTVEELRVKNLVKTHKVKAFPHVNNKNIEILEKTTFDDEDFYVLVTDEYHEQDFNSKVYYIIKVNKIQRLFDVKDYDVVWSKYEGKTFWVKISHGFDDDTYIIGLKENKDIDENIVTLSSGETLELNVKGRPYILYYDKTYLDVVDIKPKEE